MLIRKDFAPLHFAGNYCILQWENLTTENTEADRG